MACCCKFPLPVLKNPSCCLPVRGWIFFYGYLGLILQLLTVAFCGAAIVATNYLWYIYGVVIGVLVPTTLELVMFLLLVVGTHMKHAAALTVFLWYRVLIITLLSLAVIILQLIVFINREFIIIPLAILPMTIFLGLSTHLVLCVHTERVHLRRADQGPAGSDVPYQQQPSCV